MQRARSVLSIWSMVRWEPWTLSFPHVTLWDLRPVSFTQDRVPSQGHFWKFSYFGILKFEMCAFLTFSVSTDLFGWGCSALGVWYRYGRWCVGNLGPYPFQTWHDWICTPRLPSASANEKIDFSTQSKFLKKKAWTRFMKFGGKTWNTFWISCKDFRIQLDL